MDEETCNPLKLWRVMGEPSSLSAEQKKLLKEADRPFVEGKRLTQKDGFVCVSCSVKENGVVYLELKQSEVSSDRGYSYQRVILGE